MSETATSAVPTALSTLQPAIHTRRVSRSPMNVTAVAEAAAPASPAATTTPIVRSSSPWLAR
jgi:hypothetical protein